MIEQLKNIVGENAVGEELEELSKFEVAGKMPSAIVFPATVEQISKIMKHARRGKKKIAIFGNNSLNNYGAAIESFDLGISLCRMNKILSHEVADLSVTVEAGMNLATLQKFLATQKQFLPLDPVHFENRTLGGIVATDSSGPWRLRYGVCRDLVLGMKIVQPDGTIIRTGGKTVKNVAGYDLSKLFVGSMGTLGVIAEITFKLFPLPAESQTLHAGFDLFEKIPDFVQAIYSSKLLISSCEYINSIFARRFSKDMKELTTPHQLLLNVQGHSEMVATTINKLKTMVQDVDAKTVLIFNGKSETKLWDQLNSLECNDSRLHLQVAVPKGRFGDIVKAVEKHATKELQELIAIQSHAGNGIINLLLIDLNERPSNIVDKKRATITALRKMAENYQGSLIVQNAPAELRTPELIWGELNQSFSLMKSIKSKYDPHQIIVAGRFVGGL